MPRSRGPIRAEKSEAIEWRRLTGSLWVGLCAEGVMGSIEIGHRFTATDGTGTVFGRFRLLDDAKAVLAALYEQGQVGPLAHRSPVALARAS